MHNRYLKNVSFFLASTNVMTNDVGASAAEELRTKHELAGQYNAKEASVLFGTGFSWA
jgi:hypothetical protein